MKVLVCGGRDYKDYKKLDEVLSALVGVELIINGCATGADQMAQRWAFLHQVPYLNVPANWDKHGKKAGFIRNQAMLTYNPDYVVAFPGGVGTTMMVELSKQAGLTVREVELDSPQST